LEYDSQQGLIAQDLEDNMRDGEYVLFTAAHNEEKLIVETIRCVLSQTCRPREWVIVSDASTDRTDEIAKSFAWRHSFIQVLRVEREHGRSFQNKMFALHTAYTRLKTREYRFIGNLDADVSISPEYFERLLDIFQLNDNLGIAGGVIYEHSAAPIAQLPREYNRAVAHAAQVVRRECYEDIGGYPVLPYGGPDTYAEIAARMHDWTVQSFEDLPVTHHRASSSASGLINGRFRQGCQDFSFGYHPLFEAVKCIRRVTENPLLFGSLLRFGGFLWSMLLDRKPAVSKEFVVFLRREQIQRLCSFT